MKLSTVSNLPPRSRTTDTFVGYMSDIARTNTESAFILAAGSTFELLAACLFGALTVCVVVAAIALIRNNRPNRPKCLLLCAIGTMYAATALFVGTNMYTSALFLKLQKVTAQNLDSAFSCVFSLGLTSSDEEIYSCAMAHYLEAPPAVQFNLKAECASTAALTVNVFIGDAIVWWRVWAVWQGHRMVSSVGVALLLATLGTSTVNCVNSCAASLGGFVALFFGDAYGVAASALTLLTNITATSLIGYQAWVNRRSIRDHLGLHSLSSQLERVLSLLVESGVVYCVIWAFVVMGHGLLNVVESPRDIELQEGSHNRASLYPFVMVLRAFIAGGLVPTIAIYPTVIVILVALNRSHCDSAFSYESKSDSEAVGDPQLDSVVFRHPSGTHLDCELGGRRMSAETSTSRSLESFHCALGAELGEMARSDSEQVAEKVEGHYVTTGVSSSRTVVNEPVTQ